MVVTNSSQVASNTLPENWEQVRISNILKLQYGKSLPAKDRMSGEYQVFGSGGQVGEHNAAITKAPVIIVGRKGSIGAVFFSETPCWAIDTTYYIDNFPTYIYPKYIYYFLRILGLETLNRSAAIPGLSRDDVHAFQIPIPFLENPSYSLDIQKRIVARIEALLAEVRSSRKLLDKMRRDGEQVIETALNEVIRKLDREYPDSPTLEKLIRDRKIKIEGGGTPSRSDASYWIGAIPWVSPKDMKSWYISDAQEHISDIALQESSAKLIPVGSILTVVRGMILIHTLPVAITQSEVTVNQDMKALEPSDDFVPEYLGYILRARSPEILQKVEIAGHGTRRLKTETLHQVTIPFLDKNNQRRIVEYLNNIQSEVNRMLQLMNQDAKTLDLLEQSILERAFRGEL